MTFFCKKVLLFSFNKEQLEAELRGTTAAEVMHPGGRTISTDALAVAAAEMMETHGITSVVAVDAQQRVAGMVHIGDLMRAKVI